MIDLLQRETFYRELPRIDQAAAHLDKLYRAAFTDCVSQRAQGYAAALDQLKSTPGWEQLDEERQTQIAEPLSSQATEEVSISTPILQLRADIDACDKRLADAIALVHHLIEGDRIVRVKVSKFFSSGINTEEQLDASLGSLREECLHHIGKNKRILIQ